MPRVRWRPRARMLSATVLVVTAVIGLGSGSARSAETIRILAAGAAQAAMQRLQPAIAAAGQAELEVAFDTVGVLRDRVLGGDTADVVILSEAGMAALEKAGKVASGSTVDLGRVWVALAMRKGARVPDLASPESLKQALLSASSIAHADPARGATAGAHFARVLDQLGIADQMKGRVTVLPFGGDVIEDVARGRFEIGVSQSSEIMAHSGVTLAGHLPAPYAHGTRYLAAKVTGAGPSSDSVLALLKTPTARAAFAAFGFDANP